MRHQIEIQNSPPTFTLASLQGLPDWVVIDEATTASALGLSHGRLKVERLAGRVPYVQITSRRIGYTVRMVRDLIESRTVKAKTSA